MKPTATFEGNIRGFYTFLRTTIQSLRWVVELLVRVGCKGSTHDVNYLGHSFVQSKHCR